jgi:hypothetical protein
MLAKKGSKAIAPSADAAVATEDQFLDEFASIVLAALW